MCIHILDQGIIRFIILKVCYEQLSFKQTWVGVDRRVLFNEMSELNNILNI